MNRQEYTWLKDEVIKLRATIEKSLKKTAKEPETVSEQKNDKGDNKFFYAKVLLQAFGFLVILMSWISQNIYESDLQDLQRKRSEYRASLSALEGQLDVLQLASSIYTRDMLDSGRRKNLREDAWAVYFLSIYGQNLIAYRKAAVQLGRLGKKYGYDSRYEDFMYGLYQDSLKIERLKSVDSLRKLSDFVYNYNNHSTQREIDNMISVVNDDTRFTAKGIRMHNTKFLIYYFVGSFLLILSFYFELRNEYQKKDKKVILKWLLKGIGFLAAIWIIVQLIVR